MLKVHGRCDLDCDYCYMYRAADQRWRTEPRAMSAAVVERTAERIAEHAHTHGLSRIGVALHGGEPLLIGPKGITRVVESVRRAVGPRVHAEVTVQTNGVRLTHHYLDLLGELDVGISVSLDGGRAAHDRHRRHRDGRGSHAEVTAALELLANGPHRALFTGLLCVVDLRNDPVDTYRELVRHRPPTVDFLLPHANWSAPPPGHRPGDPGTPYADWLIRIFDYWYDAPVRESGVRIFEQLITLLLGGHADTEGLGLAPIGYVVVETSGAIAQDDALRTAYSGAIDTGLHVARDAFDAALRLPGVLARRSGTAALTATCRRCPLLDVCGGGHRAHRYRNDGSGFANPSVYCADLQVLIRHVRGRLAHDIARLSATAGARVPAGGTPATRVTAGGAGVV
ncbi:FxsB family radical SAM/SPASM domain protein [Streptomyces sp. NBC_01477]|nr:FxsB family cyclophane-forming radical SAM/SPASM peptide maturase [Streptomyces sp. NBC_01477]